MSHYRKKNHLTIRDVLKIGALSTLLTVLIVSTCLLLLIGSFFESLKSNRVMDTVLSPDREYQALIFSRCSIDPRIDCKPEVSILKAGAVLHKTDQGNIFIGSEDGSIKDVQWLSERKLLIVYTGYYEDPPTLQLTQKGDVQIEYQWEELE